MIDVGLIAKAKKAVASKPRKFVTPAILCSFVQQESNGVPYFIDHKPGSLFRMNLNAAMKINYRNPKTGKIEKVSTGLSEKDIRGLITIPNKLGEWEVPPAMRGQLAKFRFEPGYWRKFPQLELHDRFIYSCSWGLVQFMGPNISPVPDKQGIDFIKRFMADVDLQLMYAAGMIDQLLVKANGDVNKAYRGYNSGNVNSTDPAVIQRATNVQRHLREIEEQFNV
jgi:hypothetical protein